MQLKHDTKRGKVTIPVHTNKILPPDILLSILRQAGMTVDQLIDLLK